MGQKKYEKECKVQAVKLAQERDRCWESLEGDGHILIDQDRLAGNAENLRHLTDLE